MSVPIKDKERFEFSYSSSSARPHQFYITKSTKNINK